MSQISHFTVVALNVSRSIVRVKILRYILLSSVKYEKMNIFTLDRI